MKNLIIWIVIIGIGYFAYKEWSGGGEPEAPAASAATEGPAADIALTVHGTRLKNAMFMARGGVQCGYSDVALYTPDQAAQRLVEQQSAASVADPGHGGAPGSKIYWVLDGPAAAWTVVVSVDDAARRLVLEGYALDAGSAFETLAIPCNG